MAELHHSQSRLRIRRSILVYELFWRSYIIFSCLLEPVQGLVDPVEVGSSAYLGTSNHPISPQSNNPWILIKGWKTAGKKGFYESGHFQSSALDEFVIPRAGIYYVATNLGIDIPDENVVNATIAINSKPEEPNGLTAVVKGKQKVYVALSGFLRLYEQDVLSLHVAIKSGVTLFPDSTFSFQLMASLHSVPGFRAWLSRDATTDVEWKTSGRKGLFLSQSGFSILGEFTATCNGIYHFSANVLIQTNTSESNITLNLEMNTNNRVETIAVSHSSKGPLHTVHLQGSYNLIKGQRVYLHAISSVEKSKILQGSAFCGLLIGNEESFSAAFASQLNESLQITSSGRHALTGWTAHGSITLLQSPGTMITDGTFTSASEGIYLASVQINLKLKQMSKNEQIGVYLAVNQDQNNGLYGEKYITSATETVGVSGVLYLRKAETLEVFLCKEGNNTVLVEANSKLSVFLLRMEWPVIGATLANNVTYNTAGFLQLNSWTIETTTVYFYYKSVFNSSNGYFMAPANGTYFISCNMIVYGTTVSPVGLLIAVNGDLDASNGIYSSADLASSPSTINVAGTIWLQRNDDVAVFVYSDRNVRLVVTVETGFFAVLLGTNSEKNPGVVAVKDTASTLNSTSSLELGKWLISAKSPSVLPNAHQLFSTQWGRFIATVPGLYLVAVNVIVRDSGTSNMKMTIRKNGITSGSGNPIMIKHPALSTPSANGRTTYTMTGTTVVKLTKGDYVSIFLTSEKGHNYFVLSNSTFSTSLVCELSDSFCSGILLIRKNDNTDKTNAGFQSLFDFIDGEPAFFEKIDKPFKRPPTLKIKVKETGLYFIGGSVYVGERNLALNVPYSLAVFHTDTGGTKLILHGIRARKATEGLSSSITTVAASGVILLRKDEIISLEISSYANSTHFYRVFAVTFLLVRVTFPLWVTGLRQVSDEPEFNERKEAKTGQWDVLKSWSTKGTSTGYVNGPLFNPKGNSITVTSKGTYIAALSLALDVATAQSVSLCLGSSSCDRCFLESSDYLPAGKSSLSVAGIVELDEQTKTAVCWRTGARTIYRTYKETFRTLQHLQDANANNSFLIQDGSKTFPSAGNKLLYNWTAAAEGMFLVSINSVILSDTPEMVAILVEIQGSNHIIGITRKSTALGKETPLSIVGISYINPRDEIVVKVNTSGQHWKIANSTFSATFISGISLNDVDYYQVMKQGPFSLPFASTWIVVSGWTSNNQLSSHGMFVALVRGVYVFAANIIIRTTDKVDNESVAEIMVAVNGDVLNTDGVLAVRTLKANATWTFNLVSSVYMTKWQSLSIVARSSIVEGFQVLEGSTFYAGLIENREFPLESCQDSGPQIIRHPPPLALVPASVGKTLHLVCLAIGEGHMTYRWTKNGQVVHREQNLTITNVALDDQGLYRCEVQAGNVSVASREGTLRAIDTSPQFYNGLLLVKNLKEISTNKSLLDERFTAAGIYGSASVALNLISGDPERIFTISPAVSPGHLVLWNIKPLDYERTKNYSLRVNASNLDYPSSTLINIRIYLIDVNDNPPTFNRSISAISIYENATKGWIVYKAHATDADSGANAAISYSMPVGEGVFTVNSSTGEVTLQQNLDRNKQESYDLFIKATDGQHDAYLRLRVNVMDVNAFHPVFKPQNYRSRLSETSVVGMSILQVTALDMDSGLNSEVQYTLNRGNENQTFHLNEETGAITLAEALDREVTAVYVLVISARDKGSPPLESCGVAYVTVTVVDTNDNTPVFELSSYSKIIPENVAVGTTVLTVRATDKDLDVNRQLKYSIPGDNLPFRINSSTGEIITSSTLDFEEQPRCHFVVMATDGGSSHRDSFAIVNMTLEDVNDNAPIFQPTQYTVSIPENTNVGSILLEVKVSDNDGTQQNSRILLTGDISDTFSVQNDGSVILLRKLDYAKQSMYNLTIIASDNGKPSMTSSVPAVVYVSVLDVNDNFPRFNNNTYTVEILQSEIENLIGRSILKVSAIDKDAGPNGMVTYFILDQRDMETFSINSTSGEVKLKSPPMENRVFYVCARDTGGASAYTCAKVIAKVTEEGEPGAKPSTGGSDKLSQGCIAAIVIAAGLAVFIIIIIIIITTTVERRCICWKRRESYDLKEKRESYDLKEKQQQAHVIENQVAVASSESAV